MKPRLRMSLDGRISVVRTGSLVWSSHDVQAFLKAHYGGAIHFADRFHIRRDAVGRALRSARPVAGLAGEVRDIFGLPNAQPKPGAIKLAAWHARRRMAVGGSPMSAWPVNHLQPGCARVAAAGLLRSPHGRWTIVCRHPAAVLCTYAPSRERAA